MLLKTIESTEFDRRTLLHVSSGNYGPLPVTRQVIEVQKRDL